MDYISMFFIGFFGGVLIWDILFRITFKGSLSKNLYKWMKLQEQINLKTGVLLDKMAEELDIDIDKTVRDEISERIKEKQEESE